jgi:hypothetical protein
MTHKLYLYLINTQNMSDYDKKMKWGIVAIVIFFVSLSAIVIFYKKAPTKQSWGDTYIGMGAYPLTIDDSITPAFVKSYTPKTSSSVDSTENLLSKWFIFSRSLDPELLNAMYALFPALQTTESISYYGLSEDMMTTLKKISSKLVNPASIKSLDELHNIFLSDALYVFDKDINIKTQNGLYNNIAEYGNYINV